MRTPNADIAFSPSVKSAQERLGSRDQIERMITSRDWPGEITPDLAEIIAAARFFYLGTASAEGQPYIQHRGGPAGFLCVRDTRTLAFADYRGNRQYITLGNLTDNPRAFIFLMDYTRRQRVKLWGRAHVVEDDTELLRAVSAAVSGSPERVIVFHLEAWDRNCRQHIPQLLPAEDVAAAIATLQARIRELEAEIARRG